MSSVERLLPPVRTLRRILSMLLQCSPGWTVLCTVLMALEVLSGLAALYVLKQLVDVITEISRTESTGSGIRTSLWYVTLTGGCMLAFLASRSMAGLARERLGLLVEDHVDMQIHNRALAVDLAFYESPSYHDTLERARQAGSQRPAQVVGNLMLLSRSFLLVVSLAVLIASLNWIVLPILLLAIIPALWVRMRFARGIYDWRRYRTQLNRRAGYFDWLMTSDVNAKEVRLNQLGDYLRGRYSEMRRLIRTEHWRINVRRTCIELMVASVTTVAFFGALAYLTWGTADGRHSVGELVLFLLVFQRAQTLGQDLVHQIARLYEDHLYLGLLFEFLDIRTGMPEPLRPRPLPVDIYQGLCFEDVDFQYPGTDKPVLKGIRLTIRPAQVVALVGANGSGKTSLIKLLCRLYDPTSGRVTLDGVDIREFGLEDYRTVFSIIFQDYACYATSVRENIRFGDIRQPADTRSVEEAAMKAGADGFIRQLSAGYDTSLTRMFDHGQDISIGQWQKIALARAFMQRSRVIVLDEPTSALDPGAEFELFQNFRERIDHRSALVISHRLSTVRKADYIYVLDEGAICEAGTHDELIEKQGVYCRLFNQQAHHYRAAGRV